MTLLGIIFLALIILSVFGWAVILWECIKDWRNGKRDLSLPSVIRRALR